MHAFSYGWEKLYKAVHSLAGAGSRKERLYSALISGLMQVDPEHDLPQNIRAEFGQFVADMTSRPAQANEGTAQATIDAMNDVEVDDAVAKIISFFDTVCRHMNPE